MVQCFRGCGQTIYFNDSLVSTTGKKLPLSRKIEADELRSILEGQMEAPTHKCPNSDYNKQKQWSSSNKQGQLSQYRINEGLEQWVKDNYARLEIKADEIIRQNIIIHNNIVDIIRLLHNTEPIQPHNRLPKPSLDPAPKKTEEFGEQGENAASNLEEYDY